MSVKRKGIAKRIIYTIPLLIFLSAMAVFCYAAYCRIVNKTPQIFGYSMHFVLSNSMSPDIKTGDFVIGKKISLQDLYEQNKDAEDKDVILFVSPSSTSGRVIVHKIRDIIITDEGYEIYTYGINNPNDDMYPTSEIIGKVVFSSTFFGKVLRPHVLIFVLVIMMAIGAMWHFAKVIVSKE